MTGFWVLYDVPPGFVGWSILIVTMLFTSGLSTGLFLVSAIGFLLKKRRLELLGRIDVVLAPILMIATLTLLVSDLPIPTRAAFTFYRINLMSPMSWAVYILIVYLANTMIFGWLIVRADLALMSERAVTTARKGLYLLLALGIPGHSEKAVKRDRRYARLFALAGIPLGLMAHGYTGMLFTVVGTHDLWSTTPMPIVFILAAIVSGLALAMVLVAAIIYPCHPPEHRGEVRRAIAYMGKALALALALTFSFYAVQLVTLSLGSSSSWDTLFLMTSGPLAPSYIGVQILLGGLLPLVLVAWPVTGRSVSGNTAAAVLSLAGIYSLRYNIALGGQMIPTRGSELVPFHITLHEALVLMGVLFLTVILSLSAFRILPMEPLAGPAAGNRRGRPPAANGDGRRRFIRDAVATGFAVVLGTRLAAGLSASAAPDRLYEDSGLKRYAMVIDLRKCIGCHSCTQACKMEFDLPPGVWRSWVVKVQRGDGFFYLPRLCNQCDNPPCVRVCPVRATYRAEGGIVLQRYDRCIGCKYCQVTCPYGARFLHPAMKVMDKCTFCNHRLVRGRLPACVDACPVGARIFGDLKDPESRARKILDTTPSQTMNPEKNTKPQVFYINGDLSVMRPAFFSSEHSF